MELGRIKCSPHMLRFPYSEKSPLTCDEKWLADGSCLRGNMVAVWALTGWTEDGSAAKAKLALGD